MQSQLYRTPRKYIQRDREYVSVTFGLRALGNQAPHMSVTVDIFDTRGRDIGGGCCHDLVAKHFAAIRPLIPWHLTTDGIPMHYIANARFWHEISNFQRVASATDYQNAPAHFESTCALGVLSSDPGRGKLLTMRWPEAEAYLLARIPYLQTAYHDVVRALPDIAKHLAAEPCER